MSSPGSAPAARDEWGDDTDDLTDQTATPSGLALAPESVVVRRNAGLAALVGGLASASPSGP